MPSTSDNNEIQSTTSPKQGSLRTTALMFLLPLLIFSITLVAGITYLRSRNVIESQVNAQLDANLNALKVDFDKWLTTKLIRLDLAVRKLDFKAAIKSSLNQTTTTNSEYITSRETILDELREITQRGDDLLFNEFFITQTDGTILIATQPEWEGKNIATLGFFSVLSTEAGSMVVYNPESLFSNETVVLTSVPSFDDQDIHQATIFGLSRSLSLINLLEAGSRFNPNAQSYILTQAGSFISVDPYQKTLNRLEPSDQQVNVLLPLLAQNDQLAPENQVVRTTSFDGTHVIANYAWLPSIKASIILEVPTTIAFGELNTLGSFIIFATLMLGTAVTGFVLIVTQRLVQPIKLLTQAAEEFAQGNWDQRAPKAMRNEIGQLTQTFNQMADDLSKSYHSLETQVRDRTILLENRSRQLEATAQVAREAAAIQNLDELLSDTTQLISDYFGFYHVGIFLLDTGRQFAILQAANSEGGKRMLARSHRLAVGQVGVVGYSAGTGLPRIALDVGADAHFIDNPDLPETRSELALPLKIRDQVIGVLDVQSTEPGAFQGPEVEILQILADQIAVSIENARLLEQSQSAIRELQRASGNQLKSGWNTWLDNQAIAYSFDRVRMSKTSEEQLQATRSLATDKPEIQNTDGNAILSVPIQLREQKLGTIILQRDGTMQPWTPEDLTIVRDSITQITIALENARLLDESRRIAEHEQTVGEFAAQFSQNIDIDSILRTAVSKLGQLPNVADVSVQIGTIKEE